MSEIETVAKLREWADSDNEQADLVEWFVAAGDQGPSLSDAQIETLRATADGWDAIADAVEQQAPSS